ncbi:hypothetical protein [uncultured Kordia sp.]|uniref:RICIN domain-containing protein n=1 Tax=uncultured Kordia sp. TaxID=507699 RepID=UPI00260C501C|nr:hypothetical protein [uncultured Kordia sp.]
MRVNFFIVSMLLLFVGTVFAQDYVRIKNRNTINGDVYGIHIENTSVEAGTIQPNWWSAQWVFEKIPGSKYYKIRNRWKKNGRDDYYLHLVKGKLEASKLVRPNLKWAQWALEKVRGTPYYRIRNRYHLMHYIWIRIDKGIELTAGKVSPFEKLAHWELEGFNEKAATVAPKQKKETTSVSTARKNNTKKSNVSATPTKKKKRKKMTKIRVKLLKLVCEVSDDEGINNNADMSHFKMEAKLFQKNCKEDNVNSLIGKGIVYNWKGRPDKEVAEGDVIYGGKKDYVDLLLDESCGTKYSVKFDASAVERDTSSADEKAHNSKTLIDTNAEGTHQIRLVSSDFTYRVEFEISKIDYYENKK